MILYYLFYLLSLIYFTKTLKGHLLVFCFANTLTKLAVNIYLSEQLHIS